MKILTVRQPHAELIALGRKRIETRPWGTGYRGPVAIHAAAQVAKPEVVERIWPALAAALKVPHHLDVHHTVQKVLTRGRVIAIANLVDCVDVEKLTAGYRGEMSIEERLFGDYAAGRKGLVLENVMRLPKPIPHSGRLGLREWDIIPSGWLGIETLEAVCGWLLKASPPADHRDLQAWGARRRGVRA